MELTKQCTKCNQTKLLSEFHKHKRGVNGLRSTCKVCTNIASHKYKTENKEAMLKQQRDHYADNKEDICLNAKKLYWKDPDKFRKRKNNYDSNNRDKIKEYGIKNKDRLVEYAKQYHQKHKEVINSKKKEWRKKASSKAYAHNSRTARRGRLKDGDVTNEQLTSLLNRSTNCYWCECALTEIHIDHYVPLSKGGKHTISNLVVSCPSCNLRKGSKSPLKFASMVGKLF